MTTTKVRCWLIAIAVILALVLISSVVYVNYLHTTIESIEADNDLYKADLEEIEAILEDTEDALNDLKQEAEEQAAEIERQQNEIEHYKQEIADEEAKWRQRYEEYPVATQVWIAMKNQGWSDVVCAGIMGNLMAETGGTGTLQLHWQSNGENGYGLVQWIGGRRSSIKAKYGTYPSIKEQVQFIADELYGTNGVRVQVTDSQRDKIMNAETPEECAYAFACYYERCHESVRSMRRGFARTAYEYFTY